MDKLVSFFAMPAAVLICFGPAIVTWLIAEAKSSSSQRPDERDKK